MRSALVFTALISVTVLASQVFYTDLSEDLGMSDNIFIARVESSFETPMDYIERIDYTLRVLSVVSCGDSMPDSLVAVYSRNLPRSWTDSEGNEVWESPIVNGSGFEFMFEEGDTVLVFGYALPSGDTTVPMELIRMEHTDSLQSVIQMLGKEEL